MLSSYFVCVLVVSFSLASIGSSIFSEKSYLESVNENFEKVDESLKIISKNFKTLDEKVNDNDQQITKVALETQKSFKDATTYLRHFQEEVDGVKESIRSLNETILELKSMMTDVNKINECKTTSVN